MNSTAIKALTQFADREGHARVPLDHIENITGDGGSIRVELGREVKTLRSLYREQKVAPDVIAAVESLGFQWSPRGPLKDVARNRQIKALRQQGVSLEKIGEQFGITRQRVFQIVNNK